MPEETPEQRKERFAQAMKAAGAPIASEPASASQEPQPTPAAPATETSAQPQGGVDPAAAAAPETKPAEKPWSVRKVKVFDEEHELDLEALAKLPENDPNGLHALLGKGLSHERRIAAERARRDAAESALAEAEKKAFGQRDARWVATMNRHLKTRGFKLVQSDVDPDGLDIVPLQPAAETQGQTDLAALRKLAIQENTPEAWGAYTEALEKAVPKNLGADEIDRIVEKRLKAAQQEQSASTEKSRDFELKWKAAFAARQADFALAGPRAQEEMKLAAEAANEEFARSGYSEHVLKAIHRHADMVKRLAQQANPAAPAARPTPPTPTPNGGPPPASVVDPAKINVKTPEGKKAAAEHLQRLVDQRNGNGRVPARV